MCGIVSSVDANASVVEKAHQHGLCTTLRRLYFYEIATAGELFRLASAKEREHSATAERPRQKLEAQSEACSRRDATRLHVGRTAAR